MERYNLRSTSVTAINEFQSEAPEQLERGRSESDVTRVVTKLPETDRPWGMFPIRDPWGRGSWDPSNPTAGYHVQRGPGQTSSRNSDTQNPTSNNEQNLSRVSFTPKRQFNVATREYCLGHGVLQGAAK